MPKITELPETPKYRIKAVSQQTGVPAVPLRAWERRYGLLAPHRTRGNYRLYSDQDVAMLRWLKSRVDAGLPVRIAAEELLAMRQTGGWPEALPPLGTRDEVGQIPSVVSTQLYQALIGHNETQASQTLSPPVSCAAGRPLCARRSQWRVARSRSSLGARRESCTRSAA